MDERSLSEALTLKEVSQFTQICHWELKNNSRIFQAEDLV